MLLSAVLVWESCLRASCRLAGAVIGVDGGVTCCAAVATASSDCICATRWLQVAYFVFVKNVWSHGPPGLHHHSEAESSLVPTLGRTKSSASRSPCAPPSSRRFHQLLARYSPPLTFHSPRPHHHRMSVSTGVIAISCLVHFDAVRPPPSPTWPQCMEVGHPIPALL